MTHLLVVFFIPTKYESNSSKVKVQYNFEERLTKRKTSDVKGDKYIV